MRSLFPVVAVVALLSAGCTHMAGHDMEHHSGGAMHHGAQDMQAMCDMHKQMMGGKTEAERRAIIDEHMKRMSPEMRQHMQAMQEQCK